VPVPTPPCLPEPIPPFVLVPLDGERQYGRSHYRRFGLQLRILVTHHDRRRSDLLAGEARRIAFGRPQNVVVATTATASSTIHRGWEDIGTYVEHD
jgi:hypothetical protein